MDTLELYIPAENIYLYFHGYKRLKSDGSLSLESYKIEEFIEKKNEEMQKELKSLDNWLVTL